MPRSALHDLYGALERYFRATVFLLVQCHAVVLSCDIQGYASHSHIVPKVSWMQNALHRTTL